MLNYIWAGIMVISVAIAAFTGKLDQVASASIDGAANAVTFAISMMGIMCLWTGLMKIAANSGLVKLFAKALRPLTRLIFPDVPQDSPAMNAIVMNMTANMFGMSNAATPLGLNAMKELNKLGTVWSKTATNAMCMFVVINTASIQIIPATVLALRQAANSQNPFEIIVPAWIASICGVAVGVISAKLFSIGEK